MNFAVELTTASGTRQVVNTGDGRSFLPYILAMALSGLVLLALAIYSLKRAKRRED
jgi:hypothetical protein